MLLCLDLDLWVNRDLPLTGERIATISFDPGETTIINNLSVKLIMEASFNKGIPFPLYLLLAKTKVNLVFKTSAEKYVT